MERKQHWETVYETKKPDQVSWTQKVPQTSLTFIDSFGLSKTAKIIDVGGGDSNLVDFLLDSGYENVTVLDISEKALERAKIRLGSRAEQVTWIVSDITKFEPTESYDIWHDRATFHFLTQKEQVAYYVEIARRTINSSLLIGTFSTDGPLKCSGLEIKQYDASMLQEVFANGFKLGRSVVEDHTTPFGTIQNFVFCSFDRRL
ncbi:MAG: class I SAM-dependent methyltransferase [Crocinitomicaceae bacterium]|nr:class I SAM-dependent methyltransferase [Crocinitomicaceae bacterium]